MSKGSDTYERVNTIYTFFQKEIFTTKGPDKVDMMAVNAVAASLTNAYFLAQQIKILEKLEHYAHQRKLVEGY